MAVRLRVELRRIDERSDDIGRIYPYQIPSSRLDIV